jgi:hypothetical protein
MPSQLLRTTSFLDGHSVMSLGLQKLVRKFAISTCCRILQSNLMLSFLGKELFGEKKKKLLSLLLKEILPSIQQRGCPSLQGGLRASSTLGTFSGLSVQNSNCLHTN